MLFFWDFHQQKTMVVKRLGSQQSLRKHIYICSFFILKLIWQLIAGRSQQCDYNVIGGHSGSLSMGDLGIWSHHITRNTQIQKSSEVRYRITKNARRLHVHVVIRHVIWIRVPQNSHVSRGSNCLISDKICAFIWFRVSESGIINLN